MKEETTVKKSSHTLRNVLCGVIGGFALGVLAYSQKELIRSTLYNGIEFIESKLCK